MQHTIAFAAIAATGVTVKITQEIFNLPMERRDAETTPATPETTPATPETQLTCGDCAQYSAAKVANVVGTFADSSIHVTFDAPDPINGSAASAYEVTIRGQGVETAVMCAASPCVVDGLAITIGEDYDVIVNPVWNAQTTTIRSCPDVATASQQLTDALKAYDDAAALEAMKCPVDFDVKPLKWGMGPDHQSYSPLTWAVLEADVGLPVVERLLEIGADPLECTSWDCNWNAWLFTYRDLTGDKVRAVAAYTDVNWVTSSNYNMCHFVGTIDNIEGAKACCDLGVDVLTT